MPPRKSRPPNPIKLMVIIALVIIIIAGAISLTGRTSLKQASIAPSTCDFTVMAISDIKTVSNEPTLNNEKVYIITLRADKGNECVKATLTNEDLKRFGITDYLPGNITITGILEDMSLDYKLYDDGVLYKIYESTASTDLSQPIPYSLVDLKTTQLSATGKFTDPNGNAPAINHLGNFPSGGDPNLMKDVGKWAYVMPESSSIPFGSDKTGNWWVTHMGGIPYYRAYLIDTMPFNKYTIQFAIERDGEELAKTTMDEQNRVSALGEVGTIDSLGSTIESVFPPQPGVQYAVVQGLESTPIENKLKFITARRYDNYQNTIEELLNYDNNYFVYSWIDMEGTLIVNSTPLGVDVYLDNKYQGFTPLTLEDVKIGRHTITTKKLGYYEAMQDINLKPTENKVSIAMAKIPPPEVQISVSPQAITTGQSATLSWSSSGEISSVKLYDPQPNIVSSVGSKTVSPQDSVTYTIIASGVGGEKSGSIRLSVSPPPPPPPSPPVSRDPGVGREAITDKENTLNNMLGYMASEDVTPRDCVINSDSMVVTCRPEFPVSYPIFRILLKAKYVALQINSGIPEIGSVDVQRITEGHQGFVTVNIKNIGVVQDSFDMSLQSIPSLSQGVQQFTLAPNASMTATIPYTGATGNYTAKVVMQSKNNPMAKAMKTVKITIDKNPLPEEIIKLEKQTDILEELILRGQANLIKLVIGVLGTGLIIAILLLTKRRKK